MNSYRRSGISGAAGQVARIGLALAGVTASAAQVDIHGPSGSVAFGTAVTVLSDGYIVVTDPSWQAYKGAVYLYGPNGNLISTLTGNTNDAVGSGGIAEVALGSFVAISPDWNNDAGAVTWIDGGSGLNGTVSSENSLIGTTSFDEVGSGGVTVLGNGNYVVASPHWNNGAGAATWRNGLGGSTNGPVSSDNSLVGTIAGDVVSYGGVFAIGSGYVVVSYNWNNGTPGTHVGAVTLGGVTVYSGPVSASNSLIGSTSGDQVGGDGVTVLSNGNYVVRSSNWNNGTPGNHVGAATLGIGAGGYIVGAVSSANSLIGTTVGDSVGAGVTALSNGNYVVASPNWNNGTPSSNVGAATWCSGLVAAPVGAVSSSNSLIGTTAGDYVGSNGDFDIGVIALSNGNYVVASNRWNNGTLNNNVGAVTWGNGAGGTIDTVSSGNSLIGTTTGDRVGESTTALSNGNYVVASPRWNDGVLNKHVGAVTWRSGLGGAAGTVSAGNSLTGTSTADFVGDGSVTALNNGNYVVTSPDWSGVSGAVTWGNGLLGSTVGAVSSSNSLIGTTNNDHVGSDAFGGHSVAALSSGNYVVASCDWNNGTPDSRVGATTWGNGTGGTVGVLSAGNSVIGTTPQDFVGYDGVIAFSDGNYVAASSQWNNGAIAYAGALTLASGRFRLKGTIQTWNSVVGLVSGALLNPVFSYDPTRHRLAVGRPLENIVSLFTMDQIFAGDFDP